MENLSKLSEKEIFQILSRGFDTNYYCKRYRDIRDNNINALEHYHIYGWSEDRDPCAWFSTAFYLSNNPDVANLKIDPFLHYLVVGKKEGRPIQGVGEKFHPRVDKDAILVDNVALRNMVEYKPQLLQKPAAPFNSKNMSIHWLIPDFSKGGGGHMTIFRIIRWLEFFGHECTIWIQAPLIHKDTQAAAEDILKYFQTVKAKVNFADETLDNAKGDIIVATGWQTVPRVMSISHFRERFYLVQDYEPFFYPLGSECLAAEWTYSQDLATLCASPWLTNLMHNKHNRWAREFELAFDHDVYYPPSVVSKVRTRKASPLKIALYARKRTGRRAVELAFLALEYLAKQGVSFEVELFGDVLSIKAAPFLCKNLGILSDSELANLYRQSDIGICFSTTNCSLIPQEMMACGLPVIEINGESTRNFFPPNVVSLADPHPVAIADVVKNLLEDSKKRQTQAQIALQWVSSRNWEKSGRQVEAAFIERGKELSEFSSEKTKKSRISKKIVKKEEGIKVSVCLPTYNGGELLVSVINKIKSQRAPWPFEIVLVDSSSKDGSVQKIAENDGQKSCSVNPKIHIHTIDKSTFQHGRTRNLCAKISRGEFIAFLTQDALPTDDFWLYNLVSTLERFPKAAGVFGRHIAYEHSDVFTKIEIKEHFENFLNFPLSVSIQIPKPENMSEESWKGILHFYSDNNSCMRRSAWEKMPYPELNYGEDQVWAQEIIKQGWEKVYAPAAVVYHSHNFSLEEIAERARIETAFFADYFGYKLYDQSRSFKSQLSEFEDRDTARAFRYRISDQELEKKMKENRAVLIGRAVGISLSR